MLGLVCETPVKMEVRKKKGQILKYFIIKKHNTKNKAFVSYIRRGKIGAEKCNSKNRFEREKFMTPLANHQILKIINSKT